MKKHLISLALILIAFIVRGQQLSITDYERAVSFMGQNYYNKSAFNLYTAVNWMEDGKHAVFVYYDKSGKEYRKVNLKDYKISPLFDHQKLATLLHAEDSKKLEISDINLALDTLHFDYKDTSYVLLLSNYQLERVEKKEREENSELESKSPDGKWIAYTKDYNLYIKSTEDNSKSYQLSNDGQKDFEYGTYYGWYDKIEGENGDRPARFYVDWSPDSKYLQANLVDLRYADKMYMLDYSKDDKFRPDLYSYYRGSPGDTNMVLITPKFYEVETQKELKIDLPTTTHINSTNFRWTGAEGIVIAAERERGFQKIAVKKIDLVNAKVSPLFEEVSKTNIDDFEFRYVEATDKISFLSQRSGWRQIYHYDLDSGSTHAVTKGDFVVNDVIHTDTDRGISYIAVSGKDPEMNPYHQQIYSISLNGDLKLLTPEKMHHQVSFSKDGKFFVDNYSTVINPTVTVLRSAETGETLAELTTANVDSLFKIGWNPPMVFSMFGKDNKSKIYGAVWRPSNFDPSKKYPIIDHSYTGPHTQVFPKSFDRALGNQALAELGFVVIMVDGLGTTGRSKAFANHSYKNMGANLEDHVLAIKSMAEKNSWIDVDKVGIFGHSAGGYDAGHGMLAFPDFYKVGVASSADHDFRMEKAWWPEMYMGWPVDSTYHEVSNVTLAHHLKGKLLLVHGNMDDNVNVSATYKLAEALVKADKEFDLLIFPSQRHGYQGIYRNYFTKKRWNYFVEHLLGETPIWEFDWD